MTHNLGSLAIAGIVIWTLGAVLIVNVNQEFASVVTVEEGTWAGEVSWQYDLDPAVVAYVRTVSNPASEGTITTNATTQNGRLLVACKWAGTRTPIPAQPLGYVYFKAIKPAENLKLNVLNVRVDGVASTVSNEDTLTIRGVPRVRFNLGASQ